MHLSDDTLKRSESTELGLEILSMTLESVLSSADYILTQRAAEILTEYADSEDNSLTLEELEAVVQDEIKQMESFVYGSANRKIFKTITNVKDTFNGLR